MPLSSAASSTKMATALTSSSEHACVSNLRVVVLLDDTLHILFVSPRLSAGCRIARHGQIHKVATLQYPQFFGEMCLLVPDGGEALGTVSTNTIVETVKLGLERIMPHDRLSYG